MLGKLLMRAVIAISVIASCADVFSAKHRTAEAAAAAMRTEKGRLLLSVETKQNTTRKTEGQMKSAKPTGGTSQ